jgi:predicted small integral membrane protein
MIGAAIQGGPFFKLRPAQQGSRMEETALLSAQALCTSLIAAWLTLGVRDNILHPSVNETYTAEVMEMTRLRAEYPDAFASVAGRAITDRRVQQLAFRVVVGVELVATLILWAGAVALLMALAGTGTIETGRSIAMIGTMLFTAVWAGFLIVGNHFCYWFCHEGAQNTHYQMTMWGIGTLILLAVG